MKIAFLNGELEEEDFVLEQLDVKIDLLHRELEEDSTCNNLWDTWF